MDPGNLKHHDFRRFKFQTIDIGELLGLLWDPLGSPWTALGSPRGLLLRCKVMGSYFHPVHISKQIVQSSAELVQVSTELVRISAEFVHMSAELVPN